MICHLGRGGGGEWPRLEVASDAVDPRLRAVGQLELGIHGTSAGDQDAEICTLVAIVPGLQDAQEERLLFALYRAAVIVEPVVHDRTVVVHAPDAGLRRLAQEVDESRCV